MTSAADQHSASVFLFPHSLFIHKTGCFPAALMYFDAWKQALYLQFSKYVHPTYDISGLPHRIHKNNNKNIIFRIKGMLT